MGPMQDCVAGKLFAGAAAGDALLQNAVTGVAVPFCMFVRTAFAAALSVGGAAAAVKAAFAQQSLIHVHCKILLASAAQQAQRASLPPHPGEIRTRSQFQSTADIVVLGFQPRIRFI